MLQWFYIFYIHSNFWCAPRFLAPILFVLYNDLLISFSYASICRFKNLYLYPFTERRPTLTWQSKYYQYSVFQMKQQMKKVRIKKVLGSFDYQKQINVSVYLLFQDLWQRQLFFKCCLKVFLNKLSYRLWRTIIDNYFCSKSLLLFLEHVWFRRKRQNETWKKNFSS